MTVPEPNDLTWQVLSILGLLVGLAGGLVALFGHRARRRTAPPVVVPASALETSPGGVADQLRALWRRQDELREKQHALELHVSERYVNHDDLKEVKASLAAVGADVSALRGSFERVFARALSKVETE